MDDGGEVEDGEEAGEPLEGLVVAATAVAMGISISIHWAPTIRPSCPLPEMSTVRLPFELSRSRSTSVSASFAHSTAGSKFALYRLTEDRRSARRSPVNPGAWL